MNKPEISVIMVSDYAGGGEKSWKDLQKTLKALAQQGGEVNAEWLLCENKASARALPDDIRRILPSMKLVLSDEGGSYELKNAGFRAAMSDIVAILDADCVPDSDWLENAAASMKENPKASVVSGRTVYQSCGFMQRILSLLSRSYVDRGEAGPTRFISNNNSVGGGMCIRRTHCRKGSARLRDVFSPRSCFGWDIFCGSILRSG